MTTPSECTFDDVIAAADVVHRHIEPVPLIRSYVLENELGLAAGRKVWIKDFGWTPVGSFKVYGALNWVHQNQGRIGDSAIVAHSSGNFASGISFAGNRYGKKTIIVMPDSAPQVKFALTRQFGAEIRTYDISRDHETGDRDRITQEISQTERAVQASPYDDVNVIAGNGVGALEIARELKRKERSVSHFFCPVSGGGLMAGHALSIAHEFPAAEIIGVEPTGANDFTQSLKARRRTRIDHPNSICDGLLSYDVGEHNWPILQRHVRRCRVIPDEQTRGAMKWMYDNHGLMTEPSGAITIAAALSQPELLNGDGDVVIVLSGRNVDHSHFHHWIND